PIARTFVKHVAQINGLDKMTFADWKLDLDPQLNPEVSIEEAYDLVMRSVDALGSEYVDQVKRYQEERWVDFAANTGKDS
ncbi:oligoendopeptidase F, partial [Streptococcus danieliae]|nr:oligoendopeptidase F [Streptococcus danieliae]